MSKNASLETIQLILSFGMFTIALIKLIVDLLKNDKKITVYFNERTVIS
nr:putative holin-like toxin [Enterococcus faecalis]